MKRRLFGPLCVAVSLFVHVALLLESSSARPPETKRAPPSFVDFAVSPPPPLRVTPPEPEPAEQPKAQAKPTKSRRTAPKAAVPAAPEKPAALPALPEAKLVSEGSSWQVPIETQAVTAPTPSARPGSTARLAVAQPRTVRAPALTPLEQLSKKPVPPSLAAALQQNYPLEARNQGRGGEAKVRARIEASGRVLEARVTFETSAGFGQACRKTLLDSHWAAPLDGRGKPTATWVTYRCKFRIDR